MAGIEKTHTSKLQIMQKPNEWIDVLSRASCKNTSSILIPTDHVWLFSWFIFACACFTVESNAAGASRRTAHNSAIATRKKSVPGRVRGRGRGRAGPGRADPPPPPPSPPSRDPPSPSEPSEPGRAGDPPPSPRPRRDPFGTVTIGASEPPELIERNGALSGKHRNATVQ